MGWKNVRDHYRIGHHVAFHPGEGLCIGSSFVHALILIDPEKKTVSWGTLGPSGNDDLDRYWSEIHEDLEALWRLLDTPDTFARDLPVYTYEKGAVIECQCEEYGWPNVTHDGRIMYENLFFPTREGAIAYGQRDAELGVKYAKENIERVQSDLERAEARLAKEEAHLAAISAA